MTKVQHGAWTRVCPVLARFEVAWAELSAALPAHARVRMEGVDPAAVNAVQAAWLAVGYPMKWAKPTYACPPEVRGAPCVSFLLRLCAAAAVQSAASRQAHAWSRPSLAVARAGEASATAVVLTRRLFRSQVAEHFAWHSAAFSALSRASAAPSKTASPAGAPPALRLGLLGDCMWMRDSWSSFMTDRTRAALESCDAVIGNLETPLHARLPRSPAWLLQACGSHCA